MTVKELSKKVIDTLPEDANMADIIHALYIRIKFDQNIYLMV